jgi:protein SCO1/2
MPLLAVLLLLACCGCARRLAMEGLIVNVDAARGTMVVSHKAVPGFMPAMSMPLRVKHPREVVPLIPGMVAEFDLVAHARSWRAENIRPRDAENSIEQDGRRIQLSAPKEKLATGDAMPSLTLVDQKGRPFRFAETHGRVAAVQFLYTRCPLPEVCPRLAATFGSMARRFSNRLGKDLLLLSVTLDPAHDTPQVISRYASLWRADGEHWRFLTGSQAQVREVASRFGIVYWPEEGVITHTSSIGILDQAGRLRAMVEGLAFDARQLGDLIEDILDEPAQ